MQPRRQRRHSRPAQLGLAPRGAPERAPISMASVEQLTFGEFQLSMTSPCAAYIFDIASSGGQQGVINLGLEFAFFAVERLLGGTSATKVSARMLSPIERNVVRGPVERLIGIVKEIWNDYVPLDLDLTGFESFPEILQAANSEDAVLVATLRVRMGEVESLCSICLPFAVLDKFFASSDQRRMSVQPTNEADHQTNRIQAERLLEHTTAVIQARFPVVPVAVKQLRATKVGDTIALPHDEHTLVEVYVEGQRRYLAHVGEEGRKIAVCLEAPAQGKPETVAPGQNPF